MASRIGLRMQLMREQAQQEEQRERLQQQAVMHYMQQQMPLAPTPAINTPVQFQSAPSVPGEVLKVQCRLVCFLLSLGSAGGWRGSLGRVESSNSFSLPGVCVDF